MPIPVTTQEKQYWILVNLETQEICGGPTNLDGLFFSRIPFALCNAVRTELECVPDNIVPPQDNDEQSMDITDAMLDAFMTPPIAAPWCNGRIICLGSIPAGQTDLPPEWYELPLELRSKLRRAINELPVPLLFERSKRTLYHAALKTFTAIPFSADLKLPGLPPSTKDRKIAARTAAKHEELFFLRNHSTKEYVSGAMIGALGTTHGIPLTLGHAILARSCWAFYTDDAVHSFADEGIHRGVWAGHQYDVVHEDEWPRKIRKQWQNVSEEVGAEVISAWKMYLSA